MATSSSSTNTALARRLVWLSLSLLLQPIITRASSKAGINVKNFGSDFINLSLKKDNKRAAFIF
jgi:hypothetical protein